MLTNQTCCLRISEFSVKYVFLTTTLNTLTSSIHHMKVAIGTFINGRE